MYAAKARGRNQAVVFDEVLREAANERSSLELMLREAVEGDGLRLHYQPEVDLRTGRLLSVEALVRWQHPTQGLLAAARFIKVAEETGLVLEIGRWVFAEACRQLAIWRLDYPDLPLIVRVNMSPAEFKAYDLVAFVEKCLRDNHVPGDRLCIEITEHAVVDEADKVAVSCGDSRTSVWRSPSTTSGTGFASMTELKHLPVDLLKLDMSFVGASRPTITTGRSSSRLFDSAKRLLRRHRRGHRMHRNCREAARARMRPRSGISDLAANQRGGTHADAEGGRGADVLAATSQTNS